MYVVSFDSKTLQATGVTTYSSRDSDKQIHVTVKRSQTHTKPGPIKTERKWQLLFSWMRLCCASNKLRNTLISRICFEQLQLAPPVVAITHSYTLQETMFSPCRSLPLGLCDGDAVCFLYIRIVIFKYYSYNFAFQTAKHFHTKRTTLVII